MPRPPGVSCFHFYYTKTILFDSFGVKVNKQVHAARCFSVDMFLAMCFQLTVFVTERLCMLILIV